MKIQSSLAPRPTARLASSPAPATPAPVRDTVPRESFLSQIGGIAAHTTMKLGPVAAVSGGLTAAACSAWGTAAAVGVGLAVPVAAGLATSLANSLPGSMGKPGKGLETVLAAGAGLTGSIAGGVIGAHYGSALIGAAAGALAPAALMVGAVGALKVINLFD